MQEFRAGLQDQPLATPRLDIVRVRESHPRFTPGYALDHVRIARFPKGSIGGQPPTPLEPAGFTPFSAQRTKMGGCGTKKRKRQRNTSSQFTIGEALQRKFTEFPVSVPDH